jgi:hypothetical protein
MIRSKKLSNRDVIDSDDGIETIVQKSQKSTKPWCLISRLSGQNTYLLYPEDPLKYYWDIFIMIVLIFACLVQPCRLAFVEQESEGWIRLNTLIDVMFLIDIC